MPQTAKTLTDLQAEYDRLAKACASFDGDTKAMLKQADEARKQLIKDRATGRQALLMEKLAAFKLLDAAKKEAEAEELAAEALGLTNTSVTEVPPSDKSSAMLAAEALDKLSNDQLTELLEKNHDTLSKMDGFAVPNSREEAIGLLVKAGISRSIEPANAGAMKDDKPLTPGTYAQTSTKDIDSLLVANAEKVKAVPGYTEPDKRATKIAALVAAGIRPVKAE